MRLAGGVDERGRAGGESGGHGEILRDGDRHVVAPVTGAGEAVGEGEDERFAFVNDGAQGAEDFEVGVDLADSERAAFGVGADGEFAETMEQGGVQQDRRAHVLRQLVVGEGTAKRRVIDPHGSGVAVPTDLRALSLKESDEFVEIGDVGDV